MNDTIPVKSALVFLALLSSLPQVYKLDKPFRGKVIFTVWAQDDLVQVEAFNSEGTSAWSAHSVSEARELWTRYKGRGYAVKA